METSDVVIRTLEFILSHVKLHGGRDNVAREVENHGEGNAQRFREESLCIARREEMACNYFVCNYYRAGEVELFAALPPPSHFDS